MAGVSTAPPSSTSARRVPLEPPVFQQLQPSLPRANDQQYYFAYSLARIKRCAGTQNQVLNVMRHQPPRNLPAADLVSTPKETAAMLVRHLKPSGKILDPARGGGAFFNAFPQDSKRFWCEISEGRDFFSFTKKVDWVITNPPWSLIRAFIRHGCAISDNVCYLMTTNHLFTKARIRDIRAAGFGIRAIINIDTPPKPWPPSGFQVSMVHLQRGWTGPTDILWF